jgi:hypothetical protein
VDWAGANGLDVSFDPDSLDLTLITELGAPVPV